jgi:cation transport ATPase
VDSTASSQHDRPATGVQGSGIVRAMQVAMWLLAVAAFAQAIFAGLFLDGRDAWRDWHATSGMLVLPFLALVGVVLAVLAWRAGRESGWTVLTSLGLLVAIIVQSVLGMTGQLALHIPLGVAIFGLLVILLGRTRRPTWQHHHSRSRDRLWRPGQVRDDIGT